MTKLDHNPVEKLSKLSFFLGLGLPKNVDLILTWNMSLSFGDQAQARSTFKTVLMSQSWNPNHCVSMFSFFLKFYENLCFGSLPWILWHAMYFEFYLSIIGRKLKRQVSPTVVQNMKLSKPMPQKSLKTCWLCITSRWSGHGSSLCPDRCNSTDMGLTLGHRIAARKSHSYHMWGKAHQ